MKIPPIPIIFDPIFKPKPWGGRKLAELFNKNLPPEQLIGESWEIVSLPPAQSSAADESESRVRAGPLKGRTISELVDLWGPGLFGGATLVDGRFPLLIKFLDARQNLSVQVHPRPEFGNSRSANDVSPHAHADPVKHEAWYVVSAEPGAELFIGLKPDATPERVALAANTPAIADLLRRWPAKENACYYLPSGTPHALGAGVVVAEVQTPSDVTYRLYDWGRTDADGLPRQLHIPQALANIEYKVPDDLILQPRRHVAGVFYTASRLVVSDAFTLEKVRASEGLSDEIAYGEMAVWIVLRGAGVLKTSGHECHFLAGDVVTIPAGAQKVQVLVGADSEWLEVKIPIVSSLSGLDHPAAEDAPRRPGQTVPLTRSGRVDLPKNVNPGPA